MSPELQEQISQLKKDEWVDLQGLISCATTYLATSSKLPNLSCDSISLLDWGSYNTVYKLEFSDNSRLAASVSTLDAQEFEAEGKHSEIETMKFVRESGLYPNIPVPEIFAWETNFTNPACAPYVLMEFIPGRPLANDLNELSQPQQLSYVKSLARLQASLSKPVPFNHIGTIKSVDGYVVSRPRPLSDIWFDTPYKSMEGLWRAKLKRQLMLAAPRWSETDPSDQDDDTRLTFQKSNELFHLLFSLIPHFEPPKAYRALVLHHPNLSFQNILFDESSISSGDLRITGLIDWSGVQILPLMFTAKYPGDLLTTGNDPFEKPGWDSNEHWDTVPCDWTSTGDPSQWPGANGSGPEAKDQAPKVQGAINKFYLRAYFSVCYAQQMRVQHGDVDLARATLFRDATYYMKFNEVVQGGWIRWCVHNNWLRETYWRLCMTGHVGKGSEELITGPNTYCDSVEEPVRDLFLHSEH